MELRKDYILDRYVLIASGRGKRPYEFKREEVKQESGICYFCPGNEHLTPPEIGRIGTKEKWDLRWYPNKFAAVALEGQTFIKTDNKYFTFASAYGYHEVIAETNDHSKQLADLPEEQIKQLLRVYANRIDELGNKDNIKYVVIFKNHGRDAGTSLLHSHSQIVAYNKVPNNVQQMVDAAKKYPSCPYCEILNIEKGSYRKCYENDRFVAFTPYASRYHFEIWVFPKKHFNNLSDMDDNCLADLSQILKKIFLKLKELNAPYNMEVFYSPKGEDLHFHIEITPRLAIWAGFEIATNDIINSVSPEDAAKFYRGES